MRSFAGWNQRVVTNKEACAMNKHIPMALIVVVALYGGASSRAASHLWNINEVFSNADGTIQFVELHCPAGAEFETGVNGKNMTSLATIGDFTVSGLSLSTTGDKFILLATADFAALPGAPTPDFIIPANNVPFIGVGVNETLKYFPAGNYDTFTFMAGMLPTDGINSLNFDLSTGTNSPTNFAGDSGSVLATDPVPSVSTWGLVTLALMMLVAGSIVLARNRASSRSYPA